MKVLLDSCVWGIVRLVSLSTSQQVQVCLQTLARHGRELAKSAIITAESDRLRIRLPAADR